jgi:hypothetical protein
MRMKINKRGYWTSVDNNIFDNAKKETYKIIKVKKGDKPIYEVKDNLDNQVGFCAIEKGALTAFLCASGLMNEVWKKYDKIANKYYGFT